MKKSKQTLLKIVLLIELVILAVLLPGCFQKTKTIVNTTEWEFDKHFQSQKLDLTPGVYRVYVKPEFESGSLMDIGIRGTESNFRSILGNQVSVANTQEYVDFEYYILPGAKEVQLYVNLPPETDVIFEEIVLYQLNWGYRILFVCAFMFMVFADAVVIFGQQIRAGKVPVSQQMTVMGLFALIILEALPLGTDYLISGVTTPVYLLDIERLCKEPGGDILPTLLGEALYLFPLMLRKIGFDITSAYKITVFLCVVSVTLLIFFAVSYMVKTCWAGFLGTVLVMLFPWNIDVLYVKGDLAGFLMQGLFAVMWLGGVLAFRKKWVAAFLVLAGDFMLLVGISTLVIRDTTPAFLLLIFAVLSCGCAVGLGVMYQRFAKKKSKEWMIWFSFLMIAVMGLVGMYRLNKVVFEAEPNYLYTAESFYRENVIDGWNY